MRQTENFLFFFGKQDIFSNWHEASFDCKNIRFNCVEQFMMYYKAILFGDKEVAKLILATSDQKTQKALGRKVKNFDEAVWNEKCLHAVTVGCREKFAQNPALLKAFMDTGDRVLVEASPYDRIWGIGMTENDPRAENPAQWQGKNLLGQALGAARDVLKKRLSETDSEMMQVFVFGSNLAGRHGKGAALFAKQHHGAIYGCGEGLQGQSYGIPTKDASIKKRPLTEISAAVDRFKQFARGNAQMTFNVTPIGCGLAGYSPEQIAPFFHDAPVNCLIPAEFSEVLDRNPDHPAIPGC